MEAQAHQSEHKAKREALKALSRELKPLRQIMETNLNDIIVGHYSHEIGQHPSDFKTYLGWKEDGYQVKKGEKGFAVWSRPKQQRMNEEYKKTNPSKSRSALPSEVLGEDEFSFYGMAYLFHVGQVEKSEGGESKEVKEGGANA
jgi:N-terminal domain of anti-restriction factor ArdC